MDVKPTFFSVAGFLTPGAVLIAVLAVLLGVHFPDELCKLVTAASPLAKEGALPVALATLFVAGFLALTFALGAVLSDSFTLAGRAIVRCFLRETLRANVTRLFTHKTIDALIKADMDAREAYVYIRTCGLDLHWYAGRVRMMGSSGLALIIGAIVAGVLGFSCLVVMSLLGVAAWAIAVALYRSNKFDRYVAATAAVLAITGEPGTDHVNRTPEEPTGS